MLNTQKQIQKSGRKWQKKLNLTDWDIQWTSAKPKDMKPHCFGECEYRLQHRRCRIRIVPDNKRDTTEIPAEHTVVHELLHLIFAPFTRDLVSGSIAQTTEEQQINALAVALTGHKYR